MVSEGYIVGSSYYFGIAQSKKNNREKIRALLIDCGFKHREDEHHFMVYAPDWHEYFKGLGKCRHKHAPDIIKNATKRQLGLFFETAMLGDGHGSHYYTTSERLANDMQEIGLKLGYSPRITSRQRKNRVGLSSDVSFRKSANAYIYKKDFQKIPFNGEVYCIGISGLHRFFLRQDGIVWLSGNTYHKRLFVERDFQKHEEPDNFAFLRAYGWDNVEWVRKPLIMDRLKVKDYYGWTDAERRKYFVERSDYGRKLNALPESQRKAQLDGDFDIFEGQFFSMFRRELHVIPPIRPSEGFDLLGTIDYGERSVMEVCFRDYEGNVINFLEVYTTQLTPTERFEVMADKLIEYEVFGLELQYDTNMEQNLKYYAVTDGRIPADVAGEVFKEKFRVAGLAGKEPYLHVVSKKSEDRRGYRAICNEAVKDAMGWTKDEFGNFVRRPKVYITENCSHLIKEISELIHDSTSVDGLDFNQGQNDDAYDGFKMTFIAINQPRQKPAKQIMGEEEYFQKVVSEKVLRRVMHNERLL
jgi:hypothetical protein